MDPGLIERVRVRRDERGFTLIEMMIVVAVIAALAAVVVPTFFKESRKTKSASEVTPMIAEIAVREEQAKVDGGAYLTATACPSAPSTAGVAASTCATTWAPLRINPPETTVHCSYEITAGAATDTATNPGGFTWSSPAQAWWYVIATCDMDNDSTTNSTYFSNSVDPTILKQNEGY